MSLVYEYTYEDALAAQHFVLQRSRSYKRGLARRGSAIPALMIGLGIGATVSGSAPWFGSVMAALGLACILALPRYNRWRIARGARRISRELTASEDDRLLTLDLGEEGLRCSNATGASLIYWSKLRDPISTQDHLFIPFGASGVIAIPRAGVRKGNLIEFAADLKASRGTPRIS